VTSGSDKKKKGVTCPIKIAKDEKIIKKMLSKKWLEKKEDWKCSKYK